jgi:chemosensory pili system protein ChpB (putative protein-glutamate methylesterase)
MTSVAVAVLTQPGAAADQLREALDHVGAEVVWEGPPENLDLDALPGNVVVVNLDPDTEAELPRIEALLVDGTVRVVFNDATVSSSLSGWDLQRWARHLASKVLDSSAMAELPEPPPGSEPLALPERKVEVAPDQQPDTPVQLRVSGREYIEDVISSELGEPLLPYEAAGAAATADAAPPRPSAARGEPTAQDTMSTNDALEQAISRELSEPAAAGLPGDDGDDDTFLGGGSLEPVDAAKADDDARAGSEGVSSGGLVFTDDLDLITATDDADEQVPEADTPVAADEAEPEQDATDGEFSFGELSLEPLEFEDDEVGSAPSEPPPARPTPSPSPPAAASQPDDEPVTLADLEYGDASATPAEPASAAAAESAGAITAAASGAAAAPGQLWILAGALGASEAITQFFNALQSVPNAAFLVVTHFERGNAQALVRSLGGSGRHNATLAGENPQVRAGEILVAPEGVRVAVARDGSVECVEQESPAGVIDACARAAADTFGMDAGIIVFSGGARDGFEGALYIAQRGGVVWAQDPATCVAGGMAEMIRGRGLATHVGSPRSLADHFAQEFN